MATGDVQALLSASSGDKSLKTEPEIGLKEKPLKCLSFVKNMLLF